MATTEESLSKEPDANLPITSESLQKSFEQVIESHKQKDTAKGFLLCFFLFYRYL